MIAMAQFQGQVIWKNVHHVKAKLKWKCNKIEHLKKKVVAVNEENKLLYEEVHEQKDSIQKGEKDTKLQEYGWLWKPSDVMKDFRSDISLEAKRCSSCTDKILQICIGHQTLW